MHTLTHTRGRIVRKVNNKVKAMALYVTCKTDTEAFGAFKLLDTIFWSQRVNMKSLINDTSRSVNIYFWNWVIVKVQEIISPTNNSSEVGTLLNRSGVVLVVMGDILLQLEIFLDYRFICLAPCQGCCHQEVSVNPYFNILSGSLEIIAGGRGGSRLLFICQSCVHDEYSLE